MSTLSFKTYCIENYAEYSQQASSEVYLKLEESGLLQNLDEDYEDLHGMSKEFLMDYFDKWLNDSNRIQMKTEDTHHLVKMLLIPDIAKIIMQKYSISENEALKMIYNSATGKCLEDDSLGLYGQSALYIAGLITEEIETRK